MNVPKKQSGFTIIEVVLVLAIAGLIFLMVFIALPALQRSQRDSQREQDMNRALTAIQSYQSNNRNAIPRDQAQYNSLISSYLNAGGDEFVDPSGKPYAFASRGTEALTASDDTRDMGNSQENVRIYYTANATCGAEGGLEGGQGSRRVAFRLVLEGGGVACVNN